jgi:hypothetical protein
MEVLDRRSGSGMPSRFIVQHAGSETPPEALDAAAEAASATEAAADAAAAVDGVGASASRSTGLAMDLAMKLAALFILSSSDCDSTSDTPTVVLVSQSEICSRLVLTVRDAPRETVAFALAGATLH